MTLSIPPWSDFFLQGVAGVAEEGIFQSHLGLISSRSGGSAKQKTHSFQSHLGLISSARKGCNQRSDGILFQSHLGLISSITEWYCPKCEEAFNPTLV